MKLSMKQLGGILGAAALSIGGLGLLGTSGCDEAAKQCGLTCPETGIAEGNFAISGNVAIDSFFKSVVNFKTVAGGVAADLRAELDGIRLAFGISDADLANVDGDIGAAIDAKLSGEFKAKLKVDAQPAECKVDAQLAVSATVDCQASAGCDVSGGKASVECKGTCTVEASASGECSAEAELKCEVSGPSVACEGECSGSCEVALGAGGSCEGTCNGECAGSTDEGGKCDGECKGKCEVSGMAALNCSGKCNGSCKATPPEGGCTGSAKASCDIKAEAKADCSGSCDGEFEPPKVECDASASCEASAKADAKFSASCTPPSVKVTFKVEGEISAEANAQLEYAVGELKIRLPRLLASLKKADLVVSASGQLTKDGKAAVEGTIKAFAKGDVDAQVAFRIAEGCIGTNLAAAGEAVVEAGKGLAGEIEAAASLTASIGM